MRLDFFPSDANVKEDLNIISWHYIYQSINQSINHGFLEWPKYLKRHNILCSKR